MDRKDLDTKTSEEFKAYAAYESVAVDDTKHSYNLRKNLLSDRRGIVVTTTYKLNFLVKDLVDNGDYGLAEKNIVFIIDEAHRTTMGDMMVNIRSYFKKNGLFYGFTGTPLFDENEASGMVNERSEIIDTTEKLFGPELHRYTIDQAIADGNVLGFHVDYINTGEFLSYEALREDVFEELKEEKPDLSDRELQRLVYKWDDLELEKEAKKRGILVYQDQTHIPRVVEEILSNWEEQSQERFFNAILTVAYKDRVIEYYREFKRQLENEPNPINIAMTFSFGNENDPDNVPAEIIEAMFRDYGKFTGIEFIYGNSRQGEEAYFEDIVDRGTRGGSGRNKSNIDLIIVADQLLTGYDSKYLNTLYVDRNLQLQGLIQAYSRTNRIFGRQKEFGSIVNFQYPKITEERVNLALKLYGSGGRSSRAIVEPYDTAVEKFSLKLMDMLELLEDPTEWEELEAYDGKKEEFILSFKEANEQLRLVMQYYEYSWDNERFKLDEHGWLKYVGAYKNLTRKEEDQEHEEEAIIPLVGRTKLSGTQVIDADYILGLIGSRVKSKEGVQIVDRETLRIIYEEIQELSNMGEDDQAKLLREFVELELVPGHISSDIDFDQAFNTWKESRVRREAEIFADEWGIDGDILFESYRQFSLAKKQTIPYIDDLSKTISYSRAGNKEAGNQLRHTMLLMNKLLPDWLRDMKKRYK